MNIFNKLLLLLSLSMSPAVTVSAQAVNNDFDTFQTADKYLQDFSYLTENSYRVSLACFLDGEFEVDYSAERYIFYVLPIYYDVVFSNFELVNYYSNADYNFFVWEYGYENALYFEIVNFVGVCLEMPFLAIDYIGMSQVMEYDREVKSNSISIYNSFYNFFTGFFPNEVVTEYHGIFTFIVVGFLLFLVFGFVFFLFRVIRRLVGFK